MKMQLYKNISFKLSEKVCS